MNTYEVWWLDVKYTNNGDFMDADLHVERVEAKSSSAALSAAGGPPHAQADPVCGICDTAVQLKHHPRYGDVEVCGCYLNRQEQ